MAVMKTVQISRPNGDFELVECDMPEPAPGQVRIKVEVCGVCHGEIMATQPTGRISEFYAAKNSATLPM